MKNARKTHGNTDSYPDPDRPGGRLRARARTDTHARRRAPLPAPVAAPAPAPAQAAPRFQIRHATPYQVVGVPRLVFTNGLAETDDAIFAHACLEFGCTVTDTKVSGQ